MSDKDLGRFGRRVRLLRAWRGLAVGATVGAAVSAVWVVLDWLRLAYAEWQWLAAAVAVFALAGCVAGLLRRVPARALADSIDRRANLENRLTTAAERESSEGAFDEALREDAARKMEGLHPAALYPFRLGRWHVGAVAMSVVAASLFLLGSTPLLLDEEGKKAYAELQKRKDAVERVLKPLEELEERGELSDEEKRLAQELRKLMKDLQRPRMNKEEALRQTNELSKDAMKLAADRYQKVERNLSQAESAFEKMQQEKLREMGLEGANPELMKLSDQQLQKMISETQQQISEMQEQLQDQNLSEEQREELEKALEQAQQKLQELKLSERAKKMFERMGKHPVMKEIQELMKKLAEANKEALAAAAAAAAGQQGNSPQLSAEDLEKIRQQIEELAKQLESEEAMREYLEAIRDALKNGKIGGT